MRVWNGFNAMASNVDSDHCFILLNMYEYGGQIC